MRIEELEAQAAASKRVCEMLIHEHTERQRERDAALEQVAEMTARAEKAEAHVAALREAEQIIAEILAWIDAEQPNFVSSDGWLQTEKKATALMLEVEGDDSRTT